MPRTKANAGENEREDVSLIITCINEKNWCGKQICDSFESEFPGAKIISARDHNNGNRKCHYDFEVEVEFTDPETSEKTRTWKNIEHKGSKKYTEIKPEDKPWSAGVQFHNGGCEKYKLAKKYAQLWYDTYIKSGLFKEKYSITAPIPTYEEFFKKDCKVQGDPKTPFGIELKSKVRTAGSNLIAYRDEIVKKLEITKKDLEDLEKDVLPIANHVLEKKDYWLTIHGSLSGDFHVKWYPKFLITKVLKVVPEKATDILYRFVCEDGLEFKAMLRWGKGAGFSNIRVDLR